MVGQSTTSNDCLPVINWRHQRFASYNYLFTEKLHQIIPVVGKNMWYCLNLQHVATIVSRILVKHFKHLQAR